MKGHCNLHILFLGVNNRTDARVSWFSKTKYILKKILWFFCVNKFHDMLKFQKLILTYLNFWIQKKCKKKNEVFNFVSLKRNKMIFYNKKKKFLKVSVLLIFFKKIYSGMLDKKIEKTSVVFVFFEKIFFECQTKIDKKKMWWWCSVWNKNVLKKYILCWKWKKGFFFTKNACWNKRWSR